MINTTLKSSNHPLAAYIERLKAGGALLLILNKCARGSWHPQELRCSADAYHQNLLYIAEHQFLVLFPSSSTLMARSWEVAAPLVARPINLSTLITA